MLLLADQHDRALVALSPELRRGGPTGQVGPNHHVRAGHLTILAPMPSGPFVTMDRTRLALTVAVGLAAGFLSGLFGIGGGILVVPGLVLVLRMSQRLAHGTSLGAIVPISVAGVIGYALDRNVDWAAGGLLIAGAVGGAAIGARLLGRLPDRVLRYAFAAFLLATALRLLISTPSPPGRGPIDVWLGLALVGLGLAAGILAGLLGVGGGIIIVPVLIVAFGVPSVVAKGTSLLVIIPTALSGTFVNRRRGNIDLTVAAIVGLAGAAAAYGGAKVSASISAELSSILFGALLVIVAIRLLLVRDRGVEAGESAGAAVTGPGAGSGRPPP